MSEENTPTTKPEDSPAKTVESNVLLVKNDKPFVCVHHKSDYFRGNDGFGDGKDYESDISRFETLEEMQKWIESIEATHTKGYYYDRTFIIYAGEESRGHKEYSD